MLALASAPRRPFSGTDRYRLVPMAASVACRLWSVKTWPPKNLNRLATFLCVCAMSAAYASAMLLWPQILRFPPSANRNAPRIARCGLRTLRAWPPTCTACGLLRRPISSCLCASAVCLQVGGLVNGNLPPLLTLLLPCLVRLSRLFCQRVNSCSTCTSASSRKSVLFLTCPNFWPLLNLWAFQSTPRRNTASRGARAQNWARIGTALLCTFSLKSPQIRPCSPLLVPNLLRLSQ